MVAVKNSGILAYDIKEDSFDGDCFIIFIQGKLDVQFQNNRNDVLIMDNCSFHHRKDVIALLKMKKINHRFLSPYSPQLNPIEEYFSHFKAVLSLIRPVPKNKRDLMNRIKNILDNERMNFNGWFINMRIYVEKVLSRHDFI